MSRTKHHRNQRAARQGVDMWKPRPLAGASKTTENLKRERRLIRHAAKAELARDSGWGRGVCDV